MEITARGFGEVLTSGIELLGRLWRHLIPPAFGAFVVLGALTLGAFGLTGGNAVLDLIFNDPAALERMSEEELLELFGQFFAAVGLAVLLQFVAAGFVSMAAHRMVGASVSGSPVSPRDASRESARLMAPFFVLMILVLAGVIAGIVVLIIPGIWLAVMWSMAIPVLALEGVGPLDAMSRSFNLVRGRWLATAGFLLLVGLLGSVAGQLVQLVAVPLLTVGGQGLGVGLAFVLAVVIQGFIVAAIAVMNTAWYIDLRARKERLLSSSLGSGPATPL